MKKLYPTFTLFFLFIGYISFSQVGVGTTNPQSTLDVEASNTTTPSNTDGILIPRVNNFPASNPTAAQDGMLLFYTGTTRSGKGFYYWNQVITDWVFLAAGTKNTLDEAYDEGGAGAGRIITADNGAVDIQGNDGLRVEGTIVAGERIVHDGDTDSFINFTTDRIELEAGGWPYMDIQHSNQEIAFNEDARTIDFRVESDTNQNMLFIDGTNSRIGIGTNAPGNPLHVGLITPFDTDVGNIGQDGIFIRGSNTTGLNAVGASISFGGAHPARNNTRRAAIASMQTGIDEDNVGLAFYVHQGPVNLAPMQEAMRITHQRYLGINNTSPSATLDVIGTMQFEDGNEAAGYILSSDATGNASWTDPSTIFTDTNTTYDGTDFALSNQSLAAGQYVTGVDTAGNLIGGTDQDSQTLNLVGTTLSILNGNSVNLSSLADNDWTTVGANIERQSGDVYIGDNSGTNNNLYISNSIIDWDNNSYIIDPAGDNKMNEIELDNGTTTDPSLYFEGDTDFGFNYDALNNEIFLTDNGNIALTLRKDGGIEPSNGIKIGNNAGVSNTNGQAIFLGTQSGFSNTTGASNIGIGYFSLRSITTNGNNIAIGRSALMNYVGNAVPGNNLAVGHTSLSALTDGTLNTALGVGAMQNINFNTSNNVAVGTYALRSLGSGSGNTVLGSSAGNQSNGSSNVFLGYASGFNADGSRNVFIGFNAGYNAPVGNDKLYIENTNSNTPLIYGEFLNDIVRVNGALQVSDPTNTGYAFPAADGNPGEVLTTDGSGNVSWQSSSSNAVAFKASASTLQNISGNSSVKLAFDTENFDLQNNYNPSTYTFTAPSDGVYRIHATMSTGGNTQFVFFEIRVNGTVYAESRDTSFYVNLDTLAQLNTNDTVEIYCTTTNGNSAVVFSNTYPEHSYFEIIKHY